MGMEPNVEPSICKALGYTLRTTKKKKEKEKERKERKIGAQT